mgnify:CR=1 FL=1
MKATKFAVLGLTIIGMASVFMDWIAVGGKNAAAFADKMPLSGMDNGGPIFLFFLALPLLAAVIGISKRFGRGMGVLSLIGGLLAVFMGLVKYSDIGSAAQSAKGLDVSVDAAIGYWLFFVSSCGIFLAGVVALIAPEKKVAAPAAVGVLPTMATHRGV